MSISAALGNALSGLTASSRSGEVISANVANAMNESYARREIELASASLGGRGTGVAVVGVQRVVNMAAVADRRLAEAENGDAGLRAAFHARAEQAVGDPSDPGSIPGRITALEASLVEAAARPDSGTRLASVVGAARSLAAELNAASAAVQAARTEADSGIARDVRTLNETLASIDRLNTDITTYRAAGRDANGLFDRRQKLVDSIAAIVPIREYPRANGQIALFTSGGAVLVDGRASAFGFSPTDPIVAEMSLAGGALSGLTLNGRPVDARADGLLGGGRLSAAFAVRDEIAPAAQAELDALARDLYDRFASSAVDPTLAPGAPGLLTDAGAALDPLAETGLSGRIAVNPAVDPARGGQTWRVRDGIGAATQGPVGDAALLTALSGALSARRPPASGSLTASSLTAGGLAAAVLSVSSRARLDAEQEATSAAFRATALSELILADGVDSDAEMQKLLLVEQTYSANAQVMRTMDALLTELMGILR